MTIIKQTTSKSSNRTQSITVALPKFKEIQSVETNTGTATYTMSGENITVTVKDGAYVDVQSGGSYKPPESKTVTEWYALGSSDKPDTMAYSSGGFSGTLYRATGFDKYDTYVITPADSKTYSTTVQYGLSESIPSTKPYASGGYEGTLSKTSESNDLVIDQPADTLQMSVTYNYQFGETGVPSQITYDEDGYVGILTRGDWYYYIQGDTKKYNGPTYESSIKSIANGKTITKYVEFTGNATKPATYKQVKNVTYSGTITKPAVTGTTYLSAYSGTVTDPGYDTRYTTYYYQYDITINYIQKGAPIGVPIPTQKMIINSTKKYKLSTYFSDPDGDAMTFTVTSSDPSVASAVIENGEVKIQTYKLGETTIVITATDTDNNATPIEFKVIIDNAPPTIQLTSEQPIGTYTTKPSFGFVVADTDEDLLRVRTLMGDTVLTDKENIPSNTSFTFMPTDEQWKMCPIETTVNLVAEVTDPSGEVAKLTFPIIRRSNTIDIELKNPISTSVMPTAVSMKLHGDIPEDADITVLASNNAFDDAPTWENITTITKLGLTAPFENKAKVSTLWGVSYRIIIKPKSGRAYLDGITAAFE